MASVLIPKVRRLEFPKLRAAAKHAPCMLQIPDTCTGIGVVLCHIRMGNAGIGIKPDDMAAIFGCHACHDVFDGRVGVLPHGSQDWLYYALRGLMRTHRYLVEQGLVRVC